MWRAFSALNEEEREALIKLQRTDQEAFRKRMRELGEELRRQEREHFEELQKLAAEYRSLPADDARRAELKQEIAARVDAEYRRRLKANRRQLEEMKKRAAELERELDKRELRADEIIEAQLNALLDGTPPPERRPKNDRER